MKKIFCIFLCFIMTIIFTACTDTDKISNNIIISIIHCIETDDIDSFTGLFLPSYVESDREEIKEFFYEIKEIYCGNAIAYAYQYTDDESTRKDLINISQTQVSTFEPTKSTSITLNQKYYVKTDQDEYIISFSWV